MKQFAILFAAVMTGQAEAQCGGGGYGGYRSYSAPIYRQQVYRPVYGGSYGGGFGGYGVPYRGRSGFSINIGRGYGGFSGGYGRGYSGFSRGFGGYGRRY